MPDEPDHPASDPHTAEAHPSGVPGADAKARPSARSEHLACAQRWYLYRLHRGCGLVLVASALAVVALGCALIPWSTSMPGLLRPVWILVLTSSLAASAWIGAQGWRLLVAGDPAHRVSGALFAMGYWLPAAALGGGGAVVGAGMTRLAHEASSAHEHTAARAAFAEAMLSEGLWPMPAIALLLTVVVSAAGFAQLRSLMARTRGAHLHPAALIALGIALGVVLIVGALSAIGPMGSTPTAGGLGGIVGGVTAIAVAVSVLFAALQAWRLRADVGIIIRELEKAEPGPAFEAVSGP